MKFVCVWFPSKTQESDCDLYSTLKKDYAIALHTADYIGFGFSFASSKVLGLPQPIKKWKGYDYECNQNISGLFRRNIWGVSFIIIPLYYYCSFKKKISIVDIALSFESRIVCQYWLQHLFLPA